MSQRFAWRPHFASLFVPGGSALVRGPEITADESARVVVKRGRQMGPVLTTRLTALMTPHPVANKNDDPGPDFLEGQPAPGRTSTFGFHASSCGNSNNLRPN